MLILATSLPLNGCDMFMLQSIDNYPFFTLPSRTGDFNDPYDFFENFKSQANQSSGNRDGYGVVAYNFDSPIIDRDFMWYKTGIGNYFNPNNLDEPLYEAISLLYDNPDISRVLVHARSGTGGNGSHPFIFNANNHTYTFMHNGYVFNTIKSELINFLGQDWFIEHPSQWEGDFSSTSSFIDSEVIFHYLMYYVMQYPDDIPTAFRHAFTNKQVGNIDMEYILKHNDSVVVNFVFSDGISAYAYRTSRIQGTSYNLSYQIYPNNFVAIKTGESLSNTLDKHELIKISPSGEIIPLSTEAILNTVFLKKFVDTLDSNQFRLNWTIQANNQIRRFNIYRATSQNFANARVISSLVVENPNQTVFDYLDIYPSASEHYYWIEVVYSDDSSEITSNIPSSESDDDPIIPEVNTSVALYPNPFTEKLNIAIESDQEVKIRIYNLKGQLVDKLVYHSNEKGPLSWDTANISSQNLPNGIYILKFANGHKVFSRKVMRIK